MMRRLGMVAWPVRRRTEAAIDPVVQAGDDQEAIASPWELMWWKFRQHRLAVISLVVIIALYLMAMFVEFVAPYDPEAQEARYAYHPPMRIHFFDAEGDFHFRPFVYGTSEERDLETLSLVFTEDTSELHPLRFFVQGEAYELWGRIPLDIHLFGVDDPDTSFFLLGADRQGRDVLSRVVYGSRISLSIGLVGVVMSFLLGIVIGGVSGYYGGFIDTIVQRGIELLRSIPTIPLWMALAAALPANWPILRIYFGITIILSLIGWTGLAREVRGRSLSLREEDFVLAARLCGSSEWRIILRHMVPSFMSHIIASLTLAIPAMILAETALSFLGVGLRYPAISWGVLLQEAQNIRAVATAPWLLAPGGAVIVAVLALSFLGDGLRDAADPYTR